VPQYASGSQLCRILAGSRQDVLAAPAVNGAGVLVIEGLPGRGDLLLNLGHDAGGLFGAAAASGAPP